MSASISKGFIGFQESIDLGDFHSYYIFEFHV